MTSQLHQLLLELIPGGAKKDLSAAQAKALLAKVRPRDVAGKTRRRVAAELIADLERIYARKKAANKELKERVAATGTSLMDLHGIGPSVPPGCWSRSATSPGSPTATTSRPGTAAHPSTPPPATRSDTGCRVPGTARSTGPCTSWPPSSYATPQKAGRTSTAAKPTGRPRWKPCEHSNDAYRTSSIAPCSTTPRRMPRTTRGRGWAPGQRL